MAEHGLELEGNRAPLARWLRDLATGVGQLDLALNAALEAMRAGGTLADYEAVQELAGERWPSSREALLAELRTRAPNRNERVEIFLREGLIDDAIEHVADTYSRELLVKVAETAVPTRPGWVIGTARKEAAEIIEPGKAQYYYEAARWLERAKAAAKVIGRLAEWRAEIEALLERHSRKRNLVPLLKDLLKDR